MAERKRREKLSQCLITLAALIPGLKKMDKASVIGDAIKHVKELQERLRVLEEQNKNSPIEFVVTLNKPKLNYESWSDDGSKAASANNETLPHVEAKILGKDVLIRIQCQKQKSFLLNILVEIQQLHLFVVNNNVLAVGDSIHDITIIAQVKKNFNLFNIKID
ncbi:putative transcription factor bHLH family [Medicago truncatula]|uniref:Putative transcription factor bHLH family n=1 Tax=Medicago truncatula TaxID=3880 RepID=A0A396HT25_MEDTR|nr:putative transcription factor bHLH family [Medicago truncatula]